MTDGTAKAPAWAGARMQGRERRASVRHAAAMEAVAAPGDDPSRPARVWDVSLDGLGLVVRDRCEPGTPLAVVPEVLPPGREPALEVVVRYVTPHGDGLWLLGCEFVRPLTEDELRAML